MRSACAGSAWWPPFSFEDPSIQDVQHADLLGQRQFRAFMDLLGLPLEAGYLELTHDASQVLSTGLVRFRPRGASSAKVVAAAQEALAKGALTPGEASKMPGLLGFAATATHGQIDHGGVGGGGMRIGAANAVTAPRSRVRGH